MITSECVWVDNAATGSLRHGHAAVTPIINLEYGFERNLTCHWAGTQKVCLSPTRLPGGSTSGILLAPRRYHSLRSCPPGQR